MKEITIIAAGDRPGVVAAIAEILAGHQINILQMDVSDDHAHGIIRLEAEPYDEALRVLSEAGYNATSEELMVIRLKDEPGAMAKVAARFRDSAININAMRIIRRDGGWATVILTTDNNPTARTLLGDCLI